MDDILTRLYGVVRDRKANPAPDSYVNTLLSKGDEKILKKIGEEAVEVILAAKAGDEKALVGEVADLWFHVIVLLGDRGIAPARVYEELERREGRSGLEEKRSRPVEGGSQ